MIEHRARSQSSALANNLPPVNRSSVDTLGPDELRLLTVVPLLSMTKTKCIHTESLIAYVFTKGALWMWLTCLNTLFLHQPFIKNNRLEKSFFEQCTSILIVTD